MDPEVLLRIADSKPVPLVPQKANTPPEHAMGRERGEQQLLTLTAFLSSHPDHSRNLQKCCPWAFSL